MSLLWFILVSSIAKENSDKSNFHFFEGSFVLNKQHDGVSVCEPIFTYYVLCGLFQFIDLEH